MAFIDAWLTAYAKIASEAEQRERAPRALADLERSYATMTASHQAAATVPRARTAADLLSRVLLLRLQRPGAKVLRVFYYLSAVLGFFFVLAGMSTSIRREGEGLGLRHPGRHGVHPDVIQSGNSVLRPDPAGRPAAAASGVGGWSTAARSGCSAGLGGPFVSGTVAQRAGPGGRRIPPTDRVSY